MATFWRRAKSGGGVDRGNLREQLNKVLAERAEVDREIAMTEDVTARHKLRAQRDMLNAKKAALGQRLDEERDRHAVVVRTNEIERRNIQTRILTNAERMRLHVTTNIPNWNHALSI
ncbi:uncharacterized protein V1513DRAFT_422829 [Lipomyces chichibuensis]|uniref:uncharacterized protein n=1 Tax=Lipomyces chichibuensis TaxID=1546026 RepID=UPI00334350E3